MRSDRPARLKLQHPESSATKPLPTEKNGSAELSPQCFYFFERRSSGLMQLNGQIPVLLAALQDLIMGSTLVKCAATDVGIQWAGWALAAALRTEKFYDLAGKLIPQL